MNESAGTADGHRAATLIVLVEDDRLNAMLAREMLSLLRPEAEVYWAETAADARHAVPLMQPSLVLLDHYLPDGHGLQLLQQFADDPRTQAIPVVMLSADVSPESEDAARLAGARAYLVKPFRLQELGAVIDAVLGSETARDDRPG